MSIRSIAAPTSAGTSATGPAGPIVIESRTTTQPRGVFHVVSTTFVPGTYWRDVGTLMPNGPNR